MVDYTLGFTISMDLYYDPATWNTSRYNSICGRGNNTGFHSGMFVPGLISGNNFMGSWRNPGSYSTISKTGLTADWYRFSMIVTSTTVQIKLLNLRTNVELSGNIVSVGTVSNADTFNYTFLCYGISGSTGAYGSIGVNFSNITISRNGTCLLHVPLSSGANDKVVDICNKTTYSLGFFTTSTGWTKLSDYFHANFYYGFTLYTKSGSSDLRICNAHDGSEIIPSSVPSGYTRVANYGPSTTTFNRCESKFKLDDVNPLTDLLVTGAGDSILNGAYQRHGDYMGKSYWYDGDLSTYTHFFNWSGSKWNWGKTGGTTVFESTEDVADPWDVVNWTNLYGTLPVGNIVEPTSSTLYSADIDHVLFTVDTGVAKEFDINNIIVDDTYNRGYMFYNYLDYKDFLMYKTNKTLNKDTKVIKSIGLKDQILYDESGNVLYDENNHTLLIE